LDSILSQPNPVRTIDPYSLTSILMLSSHQRLRLPSGLLPSDLPTKPCKNNLKLSLYLTRYHTMKMYRRVEMSGQLHVPAALLPGKEPAVSYG